MEPHRCPTCNKIVTDRYLTDAEYNKLNPTINTTATQPADPPELIATEAAMEAARRQFEEASNMWLALEMKHRNTSPGPARDTAELRVREAWRLREHYAEQLQGANGKYHTLSRQISEARRLAEYERGCQEQAAARAAREKPAASRFAMLKRTMGLT